jgi:hypothetical protein
MAHDHLGAALSFLTDDSGHVRGRASESGSAARREERVEHSFHEVDGLVPHPEGSCRRA